MASSTKHAYVNGTMLALTIAPKLGGVCVFSLIDHAKPARVIQRNFENEQEAKSEGVKLAEEYAVNQMRESFGRLEWPNEQEEVQNA